MFIDGDLQFYQTSSSGVNGYASGGFVADTLILGKMDMGVQQQFMTRNNDYRSTTGGNWNFVHVGDLNPPVEHCTNYGGHPSTTIYNTPIVREKPYIIKDGDSFKLMKPHIEIQKRGLSPNNWNYATEIDFSQVYVASDSDSAATINAKLAEGLHLVFQPGQYHLEDHIYVNNPDTVVLGLGLATLIPTNGNAALKVGNVDGVVIAGLLFQASTTKSEVLLQVGDEGYAGDAYNPVTLHDMFARVGGPNDSNNEQVSVETMAVINTSHVVIDNTWFWRADHDVAGSVYAQRNPVSTGFVVNGDHVTAYGLAVEHTLGEMTKWNGNYGKTYFYQSELPYDVDTEW